MSASETSFMSLYGYHVLRLYKSHFPPRVRASPPSLHHNTPKYSTCLLGGRNNPDNRTIPGRAEKKVSYLPQKLFSYLQIVRHVAPTVVFGQWGRNILRIHSEFVRASSDTCGSLGQSIGALRHCRAWGTLAPDSLQTNQIPLYSSYVAYTESISLRWRGSVRV